MDWNLKKFAEADKLTVDSGVLVLTAFISPFDSERQIARDLSEKDEVFNKIGLQNF